MRHYWFSFSVLFITAILGSRVSNATMLGCGILNSNEVCTGFPTGNNATCVCKTSIGSCLASGYHDVVNAPIDYTAPPDTWEIHDNPQPCGWRYKCSPTSVDPDGAPCISPLPCCQFWSTHKLYSPFHHPNLSIGALC